MTTTVGIAADHGGVELKKLVHEFLKVEKYKIIDFGVDDNNINSVDYPDYAALLAGDVSSGKIDLGIAICGTGIGMSIAANKFPNVRAAVIWDDYTAKKAKEHNNANILCLGARVLNHHRAVHYVKTWLSTEFAGNRHLERVKKIHDIEKKQNS